MANACGQVMRFPDRVRLPFAFDVPAMKADLAALQGTDWVEHFVKQNYSGDWSAIPLRAQAGETHPIRMIYSDPMTTDRVDTQWLDRSPCLRQVIQSFQCPLTSVRLMRLAAGSRIHKHNDHDLMAELGVARIHVPVTTNPGVTFVLKRYARNDGAGRGMVSPPLRSPCRAQRGTERSRASDAGCGRGYVAGEDA